MQSPIEVTEELLTAEIDQTLAALGTGDMSSVAYDTAWIARLVPHFPRQGFEEAIDWLRRNQQPDGSWGGKPLHYHDRLISTLSAIVTLRTVGEPRDWRRVQQGETFLWRENGRLHHDAHDTVGFSALSTALTEEAAALDLDVPHDLYQNRGIAEEKLNRLSFDTTAWRRTSMIFSLEALRDTLPEPVDFWEANGSVGASPAATAATLLQAGERHAPAVQYLQSALHSDGGVADARPIDGMERVWGLNYLRLAGAVSPDHPGVRRILQTLFEDLTVRQGLSFSSYFPVPDAACTAIALTLLRWGGYEIDMRVFEPFIEGDHFRTFPDELDLSLGTNIYLLDLIQSDGASTQRSAWIEGIVSMLRRYAMRGQFWFDKWHISPYYTTCAAIRPLHRLGDALVQPRIKWIMRTQRPDGGWGHYGVSTAEETAYCLQTLLFWDRTVERLVPDRLDAAAQFLTDHLNDRKPTPLWLAKCLFAPPLVVRMAILSALYQYVTR